MGKNAGLECGVRLRPAISDWRDRPQEKAVSEQRLEEVKDSRMGTTGEAASRRCARPVQRRLRAEGRAKGRWCSAWLIVRKICLSLGGERGSNISIPVFRLFFPVYCVGAQGSRKIGTRVWAEPPHLRFQNCPCIFLPLTCIQAGVWLLPPPQSKLQLRGSPAHPSAGAADCPARRDTEASQWERESQGLGPRERGAENREQAGVPASVPRPRGGDGSQLSPCFPPRPPHTCTHA